MEDTVMEDNEDFEVDPAIAAAMGFSGFGTQKDKKPKFNANEGFVDPQIAESRDQAKVKGEKGKGKGKGANTTPLGDRKTTLHDKLPERPKEPHDPPSNDKVDTSMFANGPPQIIMQSYVSPSEYYTPNAEQLKRLRNGVLNENGHLVIYLPSFIEDPWKHLRPK